MDEAGKVKKDKVKDKEKDKEKKDKTKKHKDLKEKSKDKIGDERTKEKIDVVKPADAEKTDETKVEAGKTEEKRPDASGNELGKGVQPSATKDAAAAREPSAVASQAQEDDGKKAVTPKKRGRLRKVDSSAAVAIDLEGDPAEPNSKREKRDSKEKTEKKERRDKKQKKDKKEQDANDEEANGDEANPGQEPDILDALFGSSPAQEESLEELFGNHASAQEWNEVSSAVVPDETGAEPTQRAPVAPIINLIDDAEAVKRDARANATHEPARAAAAEPSAKAPILQHLMQPAPPLEEIPSLAIACKSSTLDGLIKDDGRFKRLIEELAKVKLEIEPPGTVECSAIHRGDTEAPARASCLIRAMVAMNDSKAAQGSLEAAGLKPVVVQSPRALHDVVLDLAWRVGEEHSLLLCFASEGSAETSLAGVAVSPGLAVQARYGKSYYDAEVLEDAGAQVKVKYAYDGSIKKLPKADVKKTKLPTLLGVGEVVKAKYGHKFHDAEVLSAEDGKFKVRYKYDDSEAELSPSDVQRIPTGRDLEVEPLYIFGAERNVPDGVIRVLQTFVSKGPSSGVDKDFFLEHQADTEKAEYGYTVVDIWETGMFNARTSTLKSRIRRATSSAVEVWSDRDFRNKSSASTNTSPFAVATGARVVRESGAAACRLVEEEQHHHKVKLPPVLASICRWITFPADAMGAVWGGKRDNLTKVEEESGAICYRVDCDEANHVGLAIIGSEIARARAAVLIMSVVEGKCPGTFLCSDGYGPTIAISSEETKAVMEAVSRRKTADGDGHNAWKKDSSQWDNHDKWWKDGGNGGEQDYSRNDRKRDWNGASGDWDAQDSGKLAAQGSNRPRPPAPPSQSEQTAQNRPVAPFGAPQQTQCQHAQVVPQPSALTAPRHAILLQQYGWPQSIEEWAESQQTYFPVGPEYPPLPPDFYRVVSRSSGNVYYVRLRDNVSFSSLEQVYAEAQLGNPTR